MNVSIIITPDPADGEFCPGIEYTATIQADFDVVLNEFFLFSGPPNVNLALVDIKSPNALTTKFTVPAQGTYCLSARTERMT